MASIKKLVVSSNNSCNVKHFIRPYFYKHFLAMHYHKLRSLQALYSQLQSSYGLLKGTSLEFADVLEDGRGSYCTSTLVQVDVLPSQL